MLELILRVVLSLVVVLGLFWLCARIGTRSLGGRDRGLIQLRGRQSLSRSASMAVVEVAGRLLVVGVSDSGVRLLTELDPADVDPDLAPYDPTDPADPAPSTRIVRNDFVAEPASGQQKRSGLSGAEGSLLDAATWKQAWAAATGRGGRTPGVSGTAGAAGPSAPAPGTTAAGVPTSGPDGGVA